MVNSGSVDLGSGGDEAGRHRCGYLLFGPPRDGAARQASERGWDVEQVPGGHLHQLVDPDAVTARLIAMVERWDSAPD